MAGKVVGNVFIEHMLARFFLPIFQHAHHLGMLAKIVGELILGEVLCNSELLDFCIQPFTDADQGTVPAGFHQCKVKQTVLFKNGSPIPNSHCILAISCIAGEFFYMFRI